MHQVYSLPLIVFIDRFIQDLQVIMATISTSEKGIQIICGQFHELPTHNLKETKLFKNLIAVDW